MENLIKEFIRESLLLEAKTKGKKKASSAKRGKSSKGLSARTRETLKNKAKNANMPLGALTAVYKKGLAAWSTGHRPGTNPHQWAMARVNSFIRGGPTRKVDKAEWKKVQEFRKKRK